MRNTLDPRPKAYSQEDITQLRSLVSDFRGSPKLQYLPIPTLAFTTWSRNTPTFRKSNKMQLVNSKKLPRIEELGDESEGVQLIATEPEDMWHANNLIAVGDLLRAYTFRKITIESSTGSSRHERKAAMLTIRVTSTFFDPAGSYLHVSGRVAAENSVASVGQYHTIDLELHRPFELWKKHGWDSVATRTLQEALNQDKDGAIAAVVMDEGSANICLITNFQTLLKQRVSASGSRSSGKAGSSKEERATKRFHDTVLSTLQRAIDFSQPRPLLLASPGFVAANFRQYMIEEGTRLGDKNLVSIAKDATLTHSSSGDVHSLNEVLKNKEVVALMKEKKSASDTRYMDELHSRMRKGDGRAWYGVKPVEKAVMEGAVGRGGGVLLINNDLFRSQEIAIRKRYVALVDKVKDDGGDVRVLSSDHQSGKALEGLGGIAAILTYPIFDLDEDEDEEQVVVDEETVII